MKWRIELAVIVILLFVVVLIFAPKQGMLSITGFLATETHRQTVDISVDKSAIYSLQPVGGQVMTMTHFSISGDVSRGAVKVLLSSGEKEVVVYTNIKKAKRGFSSITGMATNFEIKQATEIAFEEGAEISEAPVIPEGKEAREELFKYSCEQSCVLPSEFYNSAGYELKILVSPGTIFKINEIIYTRAE